MGYCGGTTSNPTYETVCDKDGHTEAIQVEWDPQVTNYDKMLRKFLCSYRGGSRLFTQYKSAIWWHDDSQRKKAKALKIRITVAWLILMSIVSSACALLVLHVSSSDSRYWFLLIIPVFMVLCPGQVDVMPSCPWWKAESYHQKYLEKQRSRGR